jgi:hypothetical protein
MHHDDGLGASALDQDFDAFDGQGFDGVLQDGAVLPILAAT